MKQVEEEEGKGCSDCSSMLSVDSSLHHLFIIILPFLPSFLGVSEGLGTGARTTVLAARLAPATSHRPCFQLLALPPRDCSLTFNRVG